MKSVRLIAAPFTPLSSDGALNLSMIEPLAAHLVKDGVSGVFVCGTTGESASLSIQERKHVAARWLEVAQDQLQIFVYVGHTAHVEAAELAAHAQSIGAAAVATTAPYYFKPQTTEQIVDWLALVAAAAPALPFFYYHIPFYTGVNLPVAPILTKAREKISNLAGAKFTYENLMDFSACLEVDSRLEIFFGRDEILLAALALGARGAVGSTYNFLAPLFLEVVKAFEEGDLETARQKQSKARRYVEVLVRFGGLAAMKTVLKWQGVNCGPYRSPLHNLNAEEERALRVAWEAVV